MDSGLATTYTLIHSFLLKQSHSKAAQAVKKAAKDIVILKDDVTIDGPQLDEIIKQWRDMSEKCASKDSPDSDSSSGSELESDSDSSSRSASTTPSSKVTDRNDAKPKGIKTGENTDDSNSDSSSSSSSVPATKSTPIAKGTASRSSDESGSTDSDASSSSSTSSSKSNTARLKANKVSSSSSSDSTSKNRSKSPKSAAKLKKQPKTAVKKVFNKSSSSSDSSSSESISGSESDDESSDSDIDLKTIPKLDEKKKAVLNDERDSSKTLSTGLSDAEKSRKRKKRSDDSSDDDSSSSTSSSEPSGSNSSSGGESNLRLSPPISKGILGPKVLTTKKLKTSVNGGAVATTADKDQLMNQYNKTKRTTNVPFKRVDPSKLNSNLAPIMDNRYEAKAGPSDDYGQRAHQALIVTRGSGFRKEKNKKKRGSYKGGAITMESHSFKFT